MADRIYAVSCKRAGEFVTLDITEFSTQVSEIKKKIKKADYGLPKNGKFVPGRYFETYANNPQQAIAKCMKAFENEPDWR